MTVFRYQPREKKESCRQCGRSKKYLFYPVDRTDLRDAICSLCLEEEEEEERKDEVRIDNISDAYSAVYKIEENGDDKLAAILEFILNQLPEEN